jgi:hypothetical protein
MSCFFFDKATYTSTGTLDRRCSRSAVPAARWLPPKISPLGASARCAGRGRTDRPIRGVETGDGDFIHVAEKNSISYPVKIDTNTPADQVELKGKIVQHNGSEWELADRSIAARRHRRSHRLHPRRRHLRRMDPERSARCAEQDGADDGHRAILHGAHLPAAVSRQRRRRLSELHHQSGRRRRQRSLLGRRSRSAARRSGFERIGRHRARRGLPQPSRIDAMPSM